MPTKTRPLARFGYLAFAPFCKSGFSPAIAAPLGTPAPLLLTLCSKSPFKCDQFR